MAYNTKLADRIRERLAEIPSVEIEEKEMFSGLAFLVNGKMCVNVSDDTLMCRFEPTLQEEIAERSGYEPMIMRGKQIKGYCYVSEAGFRTQKDFDFWLNLCLDFNQYAKSSKTKKPLRSK